MLSSKASKRHPEIKTHYKIVKMGRSPEENSETEIRSRGSKNKLTYNYLKLINMIN